MTIPRIRTHAWRGFMIEIRNPKSETNPKFEIPNPAANSLLDYCDLGNSNLSRISDFLLRSQGRPAFLDLAKSFAVTVIEARLLAGRLQGFAVDEDGLNLGGRLQDVSIGQDQAGAFARLDAAELVGYSQNLG